MINIGQCVPCRRRQSELKAQLAELKQKVKQKAVEENHTYIIWFDLEDKKLFHAKYDEDIVYERGIESNFEIISKYL